MIRVTLHYNIYSEKENDGGIIYLQKVSFILINEFLLILYKKRILDRP
jgi:hypothetical protein